MHSHVFPHVVSAQAVTTLQDQAAVLVATFWHPFMGKLYYQGVLVPLDCGGRALVKWSSHLLPSLRWLSHQIPSVVEMSCT